MNEDILIPAIIISSGAFVSVIFYLFLLKISNTTLRMFQLYPESQDVLKLSLRFISSFLSIMIFLVFLRKALRIIGLDFTVEVIENIILGSGKYFSAFLVVFSGFYISRRINEKIKEINSGVRQYLYFLSNLLINTAFILTGLTVVGINITVFVQVYKIILLTIGITLSLIIGIPLGIYFSNKINKQRKIR